ncbi:maleylpyruvate isomerase family mycothiol-dependent enzyme [Streptomyces sp. 549]|uniref:maleylpyruvate isomerase family mycothiol-dependent enzyme n=1 Tax=Streptomyces sp. 549 TaxID=3049076 RepID=UPI0024C39901|nr:maleylpyruvate isomerase family mycothiol-dependent enzyme [Streptomyces sp. 549]MDK1474184.1 maleylpyruvate isomerase family mycothiol-dependent enzyme [Streptomyces sp. 549]
MTSPERDADALQESTDRLLDAVAGWEPAGADSCHSFLAEPSLLPDWTRGHVLAHLARNADALLNVLEGRPMYADAQTRDADIAAGAGRPLPEQLADLRTSARRLGDAFAAHGRADGDPWRRRVELRNGVTDLAASLPFRRRVEVELHHVDLGAGYSVDDLPGDFTDRLLDYLTRRFAGNAELPAVELRSEDGRSWRTGRPVADGAAAVVVAGTPTALAGWLSGRTTGSGLTTDGAALPVLPPL